AADLPVPDGGKSPACLDRSGYPRPPWPAVVSPRLVDAVGTATRCPFQSWIAAAGAVRTGPDPGRLRSRPVAAVPCHSSAATGGQLPRPATSLDLEAATRQDLLRGPVSECRHHGPRRDRANREVAG